MQFKPLITAACVALAAAATCGAEENVLATVNGKPIYQADYDRYVEGNSAVNVDEQDRSRVMEELIAKELVYQDALARKVGERPEIKRELEELRTQVLLRTAIQDAMAAKPVSDEELRKEYDARVAQFSAREFKASHILLDKEEEAKAIIAQLDKGADFATLAKEKSTDPAGKNGGDLGWFGSGQMVGPFTAAVEEMEKGTYSKTPVQTRFGWHVILLEDVRHAEPPPFEAVKADIGKLVQQRRVGEYIQQLKSSAKITIHR